MSISLFEITIPVFIKRLKVLSSLLDKGLAHVDGNEAGLAESRLIADMQPLTYQIQRVSDTAKGVAVRVGKAEPVPMADNEKTFADMQNRISRTIQLLENLDPGCMDGMEDKEVVLKLGPNEYKSKAKDYVLNHAIPNFYFHVCMAYALLRKEGVPVGKMDYMGNI